MHVDDFLTRGLIILRKGTENTPSTPLSNFNLNTILVYLGTASVYSEYVSLFVFNVYIIRNL